ncbi:hypothetical protein PR048_003244 [Dryococelus australis]|uniref:Uncharacterized protein n=1 Tax=Dryococelus australis TaxID=614101 RepID=A0ABQ9IMJ4_9NEOP|nr:hypothetical protein PR048_003244 [Dryococelus australis]
MSGVCLVIHANTQVFLLPVFNDGVAQVILGWAGDQAWMNVTKTYAACLVMCGVAVVAMTLSTYNFWLLCVWAALFGLFFASSFSFTPVILVQLSPLERFTNAYGLMLLCQGIGNLVGPPLAGTHISAAHWFHHGRSCSLGGSSLTSAQMARDTLQLCVRHSSKS